LAADPADVPRWLLQKRQEPMKKTLLLIALVLASPLAAHDAEEHAEKAAREAQAAVAAGAQSASTAVKGAAQKVGDATQAGVAKAGDAVSSVVKEAVVVAEPLAELKEHGPKHLHNKLVHFPIALGIFGALFLLLSYRYPNYKWPARMLLLFAGIFALLALPTGNAQSVEFDGTSLVKVLQWHAWAGFTSMILIWLAFLLSFFNFTRKFFWLYALVLIGALLLAGGLGGILAAS
jgi:uncharacterized membrane protein